MKALSLLVLICSVPAVSYAHPPEKVEIAVNTDKKTLAVYVTHKTGDTAGHSVKSVSLSLNGTEKIIQQISRQDDETGLMVNYRLPEVVPGDDVEVRAVCDTGGETSGKLKVE